MKQNILSICILLALAACAPAAPTLTPAPTATMLPPSPTTPPILTDICAETGNTFRLITASNLAPQPTTGWETVNDAPVFSPDGHYSVIRIADSLYLHPADGSPDTFLVRRPYDNLHMREYIRWSDDSQRIAVVEGNDYFHQALNIRVYDLTGASTVIDAKLDHPSYFRGWSPNGEYLLGVVGLNELTVWNLQTGAAMYSSGNFYVETVTWSPDGEFIAYYGRDDSNDLLPPVWVYRIAAADGSFQTQLEVPVDEYNNGLGDGFLWSPDSYYIVFFYHQTNAQAFIPRALVYRRDGMRLLDIPRWFQFEGNSYQLMPVHWSSDSSSLLLWHMQADGRYGLISQPIDDSAPNELLTDVLRLPYDAPTGDRIALYDRQNDGYSITLMDADFKNSVPFISGAADAGDPNWSVDGRFVAAVWATEADDERRVQLSWVDASGENRHDITGDYLDIRSLHWSPDNRYLLYVGVLDDLEFTVELADITTGEHQVLRSGLSNVEFMQYDETRQRFTFVWHDEREFGFSGYTADGTLDFDYPRTHRFSEFPSPDGTLIAVKGWMPQGEILLLATPAGETQRVLSSNLDGLGDPLWSPDSRMVAFTQWIRPREMTTEVYTIDGEHLWSGSFSWLWSPLAWEAC